MAGFKCAVSSAIFDQIVPEPVSPGGSLKQEYRRPLAGRILLDQQTPGEDSEIHQILTVDPGELAWVGGKNLHMLDKLLGPRLHVLEQRFPGSMASDQWFKSHQIDFLILVVVGIWVSE